MPNLSSEFALDGGYGLGEAIDDYLAHIARFEGFSPETVRAYGAHLESYLSWVDAEGADGLHPTARDVRSYLAGLRDRGCAPRTVSAHLSALKSLYRWMSLQGIAPSEVVTACAAPKLDRPLPHVLTMSQVDDLLSVPDTETPEGLRDAVMLELFLATGARISELARLDVADIDIAQGEVHLFGKGSKERIVPIYPRAVVLVRRYLASSRPVLLARLKASCTRPVGALFISSTGRPMNDAALRYRFDVLKRSAGIPSDITPHAMRHTFASELLGGGADLRSVQELLGHASLSTTQVYTHLTPERLKSAVVQAHPRA